MDLNKNIEDFDLVFFDLETTGLDVVMGDAICEIGAFKVKNRNVIDKFHTLINPQRNVSEEAYRIHKISSDDLKKAPDFKEIAKNLLLFLENSIICTYNAAFDIGFLDYQLKKIDYEPLNLPTVDILLMARDIINLPKYNLETVANFFNIDCSVGLHRALADAFIASEVFFKLADIFKEKEIVKLDEFISLYGFGNEIYKIKENKKIDSLKAAIDNKLELTLKYFSVAKIIEEGKAIPLRIFEENRSFYLLCQIKNECSRIKLSHILRVVTA